jgi:putative CocE/NonD family hydrolase
MTDDQRFAARRPDVLVFQTDILTDDITLGGTVVADLQASISSTDADFVVKLVDVFPEKFKYSDDTKGRKNYLMDSYQMLVRGEIMRGKYRTSFENPTPFKPSNVEQVKFELPDVAHTFQKGHRIMIQIQSSWFPLADRNPQKFMNIYEAKDEDFQKATIRIHHDPAHSSKIILPIIK